MQIARKIIIVAALLTMTLCSWFSLFDARATKLVDDGLQRALVTFGMARALNAVISVVQGTEVAAQPLGVGVTLTPGQLLDPVNDLVETFSSLMMAACIALGVQKMLISIGGHWIVSLLLTVSVLGWGWLYFRQQQPISWLSRTLVILLMIRFAIPLVTIGTDVLSNKYLNAQYKINKQAMNMAPVQINEFKPSASAPKLSKEKNLWEQLKDSVDSAVSKAKEAADVKAHVKKLQKTTEQWTKYIINLIVIFLLQTLIIPVILIWALYTVTRGAFSFQR